MILEYEISHAKNTIQSCKKKITAKNSCSLESGSNEETSLYHPVTNLLSVNSEASVIFACF